MLKSTSWVMCIAYDGCVVQRGSVDVVQVICVHSHTTMCRLWCRCLQPTTMRLQQGAAGTDDASVPGAPTRQAAPHSHYTLHHAWIENSRPPDTIHVCHSQMLFVTDHLWNDQLSAEWDIKNPAHSMLQADIWVSKQNGTSAQKTYV